MDADTFIEHAISIHALREESDAQPIHRNAPARTFQSTLSVRRATLNGRSDRHVKQISIHALREESDSLRTFCRQTFGNFNPRSP